MLTSIHGRDYPFHMKDGLDSSLRTERPFAYRDLDICLALLEGYVEEIERFSVVGYMGHL